jgi:predicted transcriptional regulator
VVVRDSSKEVYENEVKGTVEFKQSEIVANYILSKNKLTRRMVATGLKMETGTVSARVNKLIKDGIVIESNEKAKCPITGKSVYWLQHRDVANPQQQLL